MSFSDLDFLKLGNRSLPRRIKKIERKLRRQPKIGATSLTGQKTITGQVLGRGDSTETLSFYGDNSPMSLPSRPNLIRNGSFEFYQLGESPTPAYGWAGSKIVTPGPGDALHGNTVLKLEYATAYNTASQNLSYLENYPAGSWAFSIYARNNSGVDASLEVELYNSSEGSTIRYRVDAQGNVVQTGVVPADSEWYRIYTQLVTTDSDQMVIGLSVSDSDLILDCAQLEYEQGSTVYIEPTAWTDDLFASSTIIRELRADNITAGTLTVGGPGVDAPALEIRDSADNLIVRGDTNGIEIFEDAGLKVSGSGSIEVSGTGKITAGSTVLDEDGLSIYTDSSFSFDKAVRFINPSGNYSGFIYSDSPSGVLDRIALGNDPNSPVGYAFHSVSQSVDGSQVSLSAHNGWYGNYGAGHTGSSTSGHNYYANTSSKSASFSQTTNAYSAQPASGVVEFSSTRSGTNTTVTGRIGSEVSTGGSFAGLKFYGTNANGTYGSNYAELVNLTTINGFVRTWPSTAGTVSHGAGSLSASSTNDATLGNHTHAIEAYDNPGTTANRLIKTGASGLLSVAAASIAGAISAASASISGTIAAATATITGALSAASAIITGSLSAGSFLLNGNALTSSTGGNIALGAGTCSASSTNNATTSSHTHDITTTTTGTASTIVETTSAGDIAARRGIFSQGSTINFGTSYPSSPSTGQTYYRTDYQSNMYYTGTRWESIEPKQAEFGMDLRYVGALPAGSFSSAATAVAIAHMPSHLGNIEIQTSSQMLIANNGTNDGASDYWNVYVAFGLNDGSALLTSYLGDPVETNATALKTNSNTAGVMRSKTLASPISISSQANGSKAQVMVEKIGSPTSTLTYRGAIFYKFVN